MIPAQLQKFIQDLAEATQNGSLNWTEGSDRSFFATKKDANLHISYRFNEDIGISSYLFLISRKGKEVRFITYEEEDDFLYMQKIFTLIELNSAGGSELVADLFD